MRTSRKKPRSMCRPSLWGVGVGVGVEGWGWGWGGGGTRRQLVLIGDTMPSPHLCNMCPLYIPSRCPSVLLCPTSAMHCAPCLPATAPLKNRRAGRPAAASTPQPCPAPLTWSSCAPCPPAAPRQRGGRPPPGRTPCGAGENAAPCKQGRRQRPDVARAAPRLHRRLL